MLFQQNTEILLSPSTALLLPPRSKSSAGTAVNSSHSCPLASSALSVNIHRLIGQIILQLYPPLARNKFISGLGNIYEPPTFKLSDPQMQRLGFEDNSRDAGSDFNSNHGGKITIC